MTPTEIRDYVHEYLDLTTADMSTALVVRWAAEGQRRVLKARPRWVHLEARSTLSTVDGTSEYSIGDDIRSIYAADCTLTGPLAVVDEAAAKALYWQGSSGVREGRPEVLSRWGSGLVKVWPTPNDVFTIELIGQRPAVVPTATVDLDVPDDLVDAVVDWVMQRAYMHQDDPDMAAIHLQLFTAALDRYADDEDRVDDAQPVIFGGGPYQARRSTSPFALPQPPRLGEFGGSAWNP
jgi:hypothetical protein